MWGNRAESSGDSKTKRDLGQRGMTLLEVLAALVIFVMLVGVGARLLPDTWQSIKSLNDRLELQYALLTGGQTVAKAVRGAQEVEWARKGVLKILPGSNSPGKIVPESERDSFYIDDKDKNGVSDLYREHLKVANPVATGIVSIECRERAPGLWEIKLMGRKGKVELEWETLINQKGQP